MSSRLGEKPATDPISGPAENAATTRPSAAQADTPTPAKDSSSKASDAGATSERRRLSNIFQALMARSP